MSDSQINTAGLLNDRIARDRIDALIKKKARKSRVERAGNTCFNVIASCFAE